jgi:hypothetical protein
VSNGTSGAFTLEYLLINGSTFDVFLLDLTGEAERAKEKFLEGFLLGICDGVCGIWSIVSSAIEQQSCWFKERSLKAVVKETSRILLLCRKVLAGRGTEVDHCKIDSLCRSKFAKETDSLNACWWLEVEWNRGILFLFPSAFDARPYSGRRLSKELAGLLGASVGFGIVAVETEALYRWPWEEIGRLVPTLLEKELLETLRIEEVDGGLDDDAEEENDASRDSPASVVAFTLP